MPLFILNLFRKYSIINSDGPIVIDDNLKTADKTNFGKIAGTNQPFLFKIGSLTHKTVFNPQALAASSPIGATLVFIITQSGLFSFKNFLCCLYENINVFKKEKTNLIRCFK